MNLPVCFNFDSEAKDSGNILCKVVGHYNSRINFLLNKDFESYY